MKYIILSFAVCSLAISCNKNSEKFEKNVVRKNLPTFESLYKFVTDNNTSGNFMLETNTGLGNKDLNTYFTVHLSGAFIEKNTRQNSIGQTNYFNEIKIEPNIMKPGEVYCYDKNLQWNEGGRLFGTQLNLKLHKGEANSAAGDTAVDYNGGYSPQVFVCSNNFAEAETTTDFHYIKGTTLKPTFTFTWNKDTLNQNGVFVYLEYDPNGYGNESLKASYPNKEASAIIVDDNGSYTLTNELFEDVPLNARMSVRIGRGNFSYIKQTDGSVTDMQMTVLTYQSGEFFYKTN